VVSISDLTVHPARDIHQIVSWYMPTPMIHTSENFEKPGLIKSTLYMTSGNYNY